MTNKPDVFKQTAILEKGGVFAAIGIYSCAGHLHAVSNFDPRVAEPSQFHRRSFETRTAALAAYNENIAISRDRHWTVIYNNHPNFG